MKANLSPRFDRHGGIIRIVLPCEFTTGMTRWRFKGANNSNAQIFKSFPPVTGGYFAGVGLALGAGEGVAAGAALPAVGGVAGLAATAVCGWAAGLIQQA